MAGVAWSETRSWVGSGERRCNEDFALVDEGGGFAVVVDGATGLTKANLVVGESDAAWYARTLATLCAERMRAGDASKDALLAAGTECARRYGEMPGAEDLERIDMPNGSVAVLRWDASLLEVTMLGDCTAVVGTTGGTSQLVHDATLDALDEQNYERMYRYAKEHHTTMAHARVALNECFKRNRLRMNEPHGYWAADISCRGFGHELVRTFPIAEVAYAFACSDGFAAAQSMGVVESCEALADRVAAGEGRHLGALLREAEQEDAGCWRHHRSKTSDDATYAVVVFG